MIDYIEGTIAELNPAVAVIDNHGIGYLLNISLPTYDMMASLPKEQKVRLYVYEAIREDAHVLYGFANKREREAFLQLISVSGVGPNTARVILSSLAVDELANAIAIGDVAMLKSVKGVGGKTAQRILVDLKDKIKQSDDTLIQKTGLSSGEAFNEALAALVMLGFAQQPSHKVLKKLFAQNPSMSVEQAIKQALKMM